MTEVTLTRIAHTGLRLSLATAFLSAVAIRFGFWGLVLHPSGGWQPGAAWAKFLVYAGNLNWFLPKALVPFAAAAATTCETTFGVCLLFGVKTRWAAFGSSVLLMIFALAMMGDEVRSPFDYSVFTASFGALTFGLLTQAEGERNKSTNSSSCKRDRRMYA